MRVQGRIPIVLAVCLIVFVMIFEVSAAEKKKSKPEPATAHLYATEPAPLSPVQCGQCHSALYGDLRSSGGGHRFECQKCHQSFHAYSPIKKNWVELMPKCRGCHLLPHGEKITDCTSCHSNPHAATRIPMSTTLVGSCAACHSSPFDQLQKFPSKHSKLSCDNCHTSHGYIPGCGSCHKVHYEGQEFTSCGIECHPVHQPRSIAYKPDADSRTCGVCHGKVYSRWGKGVSKHAKVACAACHSRHRYIPDCGVCHQFPHTKQLHEKFPKCITCHQDPHDLPVKQRGK